MPQFPGRDRGQRQSVPKFIRVLSGDKVRYGSPEVLNRAVCTGIFIAAAAAAAAEIYHSGEKKRLYNKEMKI